MHALKNWCAHRSGAAMTIHGDDERGHRRKLAGVKLIEPSADLVHAMQARLADGSTIQLLA
jgi:hypothetical protein